MMLGRNIWIFQANPKRYDIVNALLDPALKEQGWTINQHKKEIRMGDTALIWMSGKKGGIYAIAEVISDPIFMVDRPEENKYWTAEKDRGRSRLRVRIKIIKSLVSDPILREELKNINELKNLSILRFWQGTNFPVNNSEWQVIKQRIDNERK